VKQGRTALNEHQSARSGEVCPENQTQIPKGGSMNEANIAVDGTPLEDVLVFQQSKEIVSSI
jgi:hypothetical protein